MADKILATVGGQAVTERDVDELIMSLGQRGQAYNNPEGRRIVLQQVIGNKLLLLDAKRNLYEAEPAFREQLNRLKDNLLISYAGEKAISSVTVNETTYFLSKEVVTPKTTGRKEVFHISAKVVGTCCASQ